MIYMCLVCTAVLKRILISFKFALVSVFLHTSVVVLVIIFALITRHCSVP